MQRGFTLTELLVVVLILGIIASIALPDFSASRQYALDMAAEETAIALRLARDESIRTGKVHAFKIDNKLAVYEVDLSSANPDSPVAYKHHPFTKQVYPQALSELIGNDDVVLSSPQPFVFFLGENITNVSLLNVVFFDEEGMPFYMDTSKKFMHQAASETITFTYADAIKTVVLDAGYGQVHIR